MILDVGGIDNTDGMSYPPKSFLDDSFLDNARKVLGQNGMLIINFVARAKEMLDEGLSQLAKFFPLLEEIDVDDDLNRVVIAMTCKKLDTADCAEKFKRYVKCTWDNSLQIDGLLDKLRPLVFDA